MQRRILTGGLLLLSLISSLHARAQIASPGNAGGNSGNNTSGSSQTTLSTPGFSAPELIPQTNSISVTSTGVITAPPAVIGAVSTAVTSQPSVIADVLTSTPPQLGTLGQATAIDVILTSGSSATAAGSITELAQQVSQFTQGETMLNISSRATGNEGEITITTNSLNVNSNNISLQISVPETQRVAVAQFGAIAIVAGMNQQSLAIGAGIVSLGASPIQTAQLMLALQGLATANTLTSLGAGITAFNTIVDSSSEGLLRALISNPAFQAARTTLINARGVLDTASP